MSAPIAQTSDAALPVREVNTKLKQWIERLGRIWVEGEVAQLNVKPSWRFSYITLRDTEEESSIQITVDTKTMLAMNPPLETGARVRMLGKPAYYTGRGSLSLWVTQIEPVGIGDLLARVERLRQTLIQEGHTDPNKKKRPPFLPRKVGLITGRASAAEKDVQRIAYERWPQVHFEIRNTAVQGARAVPEIIPALQELDADPLVDVIIIARGGGSVEDLLPFSEEALQRAVIQCSTPVVSAIGHAPDHPVLDDVADIRAATPTDAAKRIIPDVVGELQILAELRHRAAEALRNWVRNESRYVAQLRSRPALADPRHRITQEGQELSHDRENLRRAIENYLMRQQVEVESLKNRWRPLGPGETLKRGYAVVQLVEGDQDTPKALVDSYTLSPPGSKLSIRVQDGTITAAALKTQPKGEA